MTKFKKVLLGFGVGVCVLALALSWTIFKPAKAQEDDVNLHIKLEGSLNNGVNWHNYSGTEFSGGESITANPGDTVLMRVKIWNTGDGNAYDVVSSGTLTNFAYVNAVNVVSTDADGNGRSYTVDPGVTGGTISQVNLGGTEPCTAQTGSECATLNFVLSDNFPVGQTVIVSEITIDSYTDRRVANSLFNDMIREAYAVGTGRKSAARIVVNVAQPEVTELPQTGGSI